MQTTTLDMHIRWPELAAIFAIAKPNHMNGTSTLSFQFFDRAGAAAFKVFLNFGGKATPETAARFTELRDRGSAVLLVEEHAQNALHVADALAFMELGTIVWSGPIGQADMDLLAAFMPSGRPVLVLASKSDKLTITECRSAVAAMRHDLDGRFLQQSHGVTVVAFSATKRTGVDAADAVIEAWLSDG